MQNPEDIPIPTSRPPPTRTAGTLRRAKTLTRPERGVAQAPLINPPAPFMPANVLPTSSATLAQAAQAKADAENASSWSVWSIFAHIVTFWAPPVLLSSIGGIKDRPSRQAWREKVALCFIALLLGGIVGFATMGLSKALCPDNQMSDLFIDLNTTSLVLSIDGSVFNISQSLPTANVNFYQLSANLSGRDITPFFTRTAANFRSCNGLKFKAATDDPCGSATPCALEAPIASTFSKYRLINTTFIVGYDWDHVAKLDNYMVLDGNVLNMNPYMIANPKAVAGDSVDKAIRTVLKGQSGAYGKDATMQFSNREDLKAAMPCLKERYLAGNIDKISPGCFVSTLFLYSSLIVILGVVMVRFAMACVFSWFMSHRLVAPPKNLNRKMISPAVMPEGANIAVDSKNGTAPWAKKKTSQKLSKAGKSATSLATTDTGAPSTTITMGSIGAEIFAVCLVTCYSEGEESIKTTCDSIAGTNYSDSRKLLFIVADGMITGAGEKASTPDICVSLLEADPRFGNPMPMSYNAVGLGAKKENRAMVYAGHYLCKGHRTPTVIIVKCGTENEAATDKKPGNRGKRDSQLILMNFFSRVTYNDRMTPLDFDLFRKTQVLMGVTPDYFEVCLMVDADTKVYPDSMTQLVNSMHHDKMIMGVCGETRIANKRQSWVTAIQVYEYFISHHLAKAFESVFGGVTCLPGCFSMYRLKARKEADDDWVPLIIKPEIVREYSQSEVTTLHQKNLLLLGEDRFLTTILLRTFPNRKMMFCPQAKCRTVVPDTFSILLSQRRRWINSTIHNLMELVLVRNLCGTFCFSMQFVVFMDLLGTTVLPVGLSLTYALVVALALDPPKTFEKSIPLVLLVTVTGLPAILILLTTRKVVYVAWMFIYLIALPIWNFILPVYAFWHFDDFSWGETRKVEGEGKDTGHDTKAGPYEGGTTVPMRRWEDWERSRLRKIRREEKRRRDLERSYPRGSFAPGGREYYNPQSEYFEGSDTQSLAPSEDDQWGGQIGGYNENGSQFPPPPQPFVPEDGTSTPGGGVVGGAELEAMLEMGFDDTPRGDQPGAFYPPQPGFGQNGYRGSDSSGRGFNAYANPPSNRSSPGRPPIHEAMSPIQPTIQPTSTTSSVGADWKTHLKKRSGGRGGAVEGEREEWGPLGPLDPDGPTPGDFGGGRF